MANLTAADTDKKLSFENRMRNRFTMIDYRFRNPKTDKNKDQKVRKISPRLEADFEKDFHRQNFILETEENTKKSNYIFGGRNANNQKQNYGNSKSFTSRANDTDLSKAKDRNQLKILSSKLRQYKLDDYQENLFNFVRERFVDKDAKPVNYLKGNGLYQDPERKDVIIDKNGNKLENEQTDEYKRKQKLSYVKRNLNNRINQNRINSFNIKLASDVPSKFEKSLYIQSARNSPTPENNPRNCFKSGSNYRNNYMFPDESVPRKAAKIKDFKFDDSKVETFVLSKSKLSETKPLEKKIHVKNCSNSLMLMNESCPPSVTNESNKTYVGYYNKLRKGLHEKHANLLYKNDHKAIETGVINKIGGQMHLVKDRYADIEMSELK